jgi:hypothetical protein
VSRWGADIEYLTISTAAANNARALSQAEEAPIGLTPRTTTLGLHLADRGSRESSFLLVRHLPAALQIAGAFLPTDGYSRLFAKAGLLYLVAAGRVARRCANPSDCLALAEPMPAERHARAWHLEARQVPWNGQFLPARST